MTGAGRWRLVVPVTTRKGPGHRSHLSPADSRKHRTLCGVENNANGMRPLGFGTTPGNLAHCRNEVARVHTCRHLCGNCERQARAQEEFNPHD